jgi:hypothetical protein
MYTKREDVSWTTKKTMDIEAEIGHLPNHEVENKKGREIKYFDTEYSYVYNEFY